MQQFKEKQVQKPKQTQKQTQKQKQKQKEKPKPKPKQTPTSGALKRLAAAGLKQGELMEIWKRDNNPSKVIDALIDSFGDDSE